MSDAAEELEDVEAIEPVDVPGDDVPEAPEGFHDQDNQPEDFYQEEQPYDDVSK